MTLRRILRDTAGFLLFWGCLFAAYGIADLIG